MYPCMYLISPPIEGSLPPPFASLGTETGRTRSWEAFGHPGAFLGLWTSGYWARRTRAVEAFPRPPPSIKLRMKERPWRNEARDLNPAKILGKSKDDAASSLAVSVHFVSARRWAISITDLSLATSCKEESSYHVRMSSTPVARAWKGDKSSRSLLRQSDRS